MTPITPENIPPRLWELIDAACDGTISDADSVELREWLKADPKALDFYLDVLNINADMFWLVSAGQHSTMDPGRREVQKPIVIPAPPRSPLLGFLADCAQGGLGYLNQNSPWAFIAIFAIVGALFLGVAYFATNRGGGAPARGDLVAQITTLKDCRWAEDAPRLDIFAKLEAGQQLDLESGLAEITYASGAKVLLEGPARYEAQGKNAGFLHGGKLVARADTDRAHGFTVTTPEARFVDLGTEFGVQVQGGHSEVHVRQGAVAASAIAGGDSAPIAVLRGLAYRFSADRPKPVPIAYRAALFSAAPSNELPPIATPLPPGRHFAAVENSSFEEPRVEPGKTRGGSNSWTMDMAGWKVIDTGNPEFGGAGVRNEPSLFSQPTPDGNQSGFLNQGELRQELNEKLAANKRYELTYAVGAQLGNYTPNYTAELRAGDTVLATQTNPVLPEKGKFAKVSLTFATADAHPCMGQPITIVLRSNGSLQTNTQNHFDQVQLEVTELK